MPNYHSPLGPHVHDPYQLGAAGMPYSTQADYRPIPAGATGTLFDPERLTKGYVRQEIGDGIHYVTSGAYDAMFVQTGNGVIVVDTPPLLGENMRRAITEVTNEPVTHFIYSHWHKDHTGASGLWGPNVTYIGHTTTRDHLLRWPDASPVPTETFETRNNARRERRHAGAFVQRPEPLRRKHFHLCAQAESARGHRYHQPWLDSL